MRTVKLLYLSIFLFGCGIDRHDSSDCAQKGSALSVGRLHCYPIKIEGRASFIIIDEENYYYLLSNLGVVSSKSEFFLKRNKLIAQSIELDSATYRAHISEIVLPDSSDKRFITASINTLKEMQSKSGMVKLKLDSGTIYDRTNILFYLLTDSFKITRQDNSGDLIMTR